MASKIKIRISYIALLFFSVFISVAKGDACGGLLESDAGEFDLPQGYNIDGDYECVWVIQLLSRQTVNFTLSRLDSNSATVSLYPEHDASETTLNPIRLSKSDVGQSIQSAGQTLVVILSRSDYSTGLSFTWDSVSSASTEVLTAVNYVDSGNGRILWNRFTRRERLTWALNLESAQSLALAAETKFERCEMPNPCECSYLGLYEVTNTGYLREVTRVCGRSSNFETAGLYPKLLAFVYINSTTSLTDHVQLTWTNGPVGTEQPQPEPSTTTTTATTTTTTTTTEAPIETTTESSIVHLDCGGLIQLPPAGGSVSVEYKFLELYSNNENCLWTLDNSNFGGKFVSNVSVQITNHGIETCCDGISVLQWTKEDGLTSHLLQPDTDNEYTFVGAEGAFISFFSNHERRATGFILLITVAEYLPIYSGDNWAFSHSSSAPPNILPIQYGNNDRTTLVINPVNATVSFTLDYLYLQSCSNCACDTLEIFDIAPGGNFAKRARLCGNHESPTATFATEYPVLLLFASDETITDSRGFEISWNFTPALN